MCMFVRMYFSLASAADKKKLQKSLRMLIVIGPVVVDSLHELSSLQKIFFTSLLNLAPLRQ